MKIPLLSGLQGFDGVGARSWGFVSTGLALEIVVVDSSLTKGRRHCVY